MEGLLRVWAMKPGEAHARAKDRIVQEAKRWEDDKARLAKQADALAFAKRCSSAPVRWRCYEGGPGSTLHLDIPHGRHRHASSPWVQQGLAWDKVTRRVAAYHLTCIRAWRMAK